METPNGSDGSTWQRPDAPLGTLIYRAGLLSKEKLETALVESQQQGRRLGEVLLQKGWLQEADLARLLAGQKSLPFISLRGRGFDPEVARLLPEETCRFHCVMPVEREGDAVLVALADPTDEAAMRAIRSALTHTFSLAVSTRSEIFAALENVFRGNDSASARMQDAPSAQPTSMSVASPAAPVDELEPSALRVATPPETVDIASTEPPPVASNSRRIDDSSLLPSFRVSAPAPTPPGPEPASAAPESAFAPQSSATAPAAPSSRLADLPPDVEQPEAQPPPAAAPERENASFAPPASSADVPARTDGLDLDEDVKPFRLSLNLEDESSVEVGLFADEASAEQAGGELVTRLVSAGEWPRVGHKFFNPVKIVSIEISKRQKWPGSSDRARWSPPPPPRAAATGS